MTVDPDNWLPPKNFTFVLEDLEEHHRDWYDNCMGTMKVNEKSNDDSTVDVTVNWVQISRHLSNPRLAFFIRKSVNETPALSGKEVFTKKLPLGSRLM